MDWGWVGRSVSGWPLRQRGAPPDINSSAIWATLCLGKWLLQQRRPWMKVGTWGAPAEGGCWYVRAEAAGGLRGQKILVLWLYTVMTQHEEEQQLFLPRGAEGSPWARPRAGLGDHQKPGGLVAVSYQNHQLAGPVHRSAAMFVHM